MSIINGATWAGLGYAKLGPKDVNDEERTSIMAERLERFCNAEVLVSGNETWIRDRARKKGHKPGLALREVARFNRNNFGNEDVYEFVANYLNSPYATAQSHFASDSSSESFLSFVHNIASGNDRYKAFYDLMRGFEFCDPRSIKRLMRNHALPAFFAAYPRSQVLAYETNYDYEKRYVLLRGGYTFEQYPPKEFQASGLDSFQTLEKWQSVSPMFQPRILGLLAAYAFFPYIHCVVAGSAGLLLVFVLDKPEKYEPSDFPFSWLSLAVQGSDFGDTTNAKSMHERMLDSEKFNADDIVRLMEWLVERYNDFTFHQTDPSEFQTDGFVDFVLALEHVLTIDRILRKSLLCMTSQESSVRVFATMEVADILGTLRRHWTSTSAEDSFKRLFNPIEGRRLVVDCLQRMPEPFKTYLSEVNNNIYTELEERISSSVWRKSKITENASGVMVRMVKKDRLTKERRLTGEEKEESWPEFTANVIRALRNTHHGYLTSTDRTFRPSRYLALVNGDTPYLMCYLGILWTFSLLADPAAMIGWNWMPTGEWN